MGKAAFMDFTIAVVRKLEGQVGLAVSPLLVRRACLWLPQALAYLVRD